MIERIEETLKQFLNDVEDVKDQKFLEELRLKYMGKKGLVTSLMPLLKDVPNEQKRDMGMKINSVKKEIEEKLSSLAEKLANQKMLNEINNAEHIDITLPVDCGVGSLHPRTIIQKEVEDVFISMGFAVDMGNEVETEYNNFDAVNVPVTHPARDTQDTFWLSNGEVLKTLLQQVNTVYLLSTKANVKLFSQVVVLEMKH